MRIIRNLHLKNLDDIFFEIVTGISVHRFDLELWTIEMLQEAASAFEISLLTDDEFPF